MDITNSKLKTENRHIAIVCNPKSGKGKPLKLLPKFEAFVISFGFSFELFIDKLPATLENFTDLVMMGGDGTINYVVNHFKEISIPIGIIRCGTGNDFTELLFGKKSMEQHFETALFALPKLVDAGICNGKLFTNGVGIGFDGWVVHKLLAKSFFSGKAAYYSTVLSLLLFYRESNISITVDGETQKPDCDLIIYSLKENQDLKKCIILSLKTSLRERAGQTYKWKLLMEIATTENSIKKKYNISYNPDEMPIVCFATVNFYNEINSFPFIVMCRVIAQCLQWR